MGLPQYFQGQKAGLESIYLTQQQLPTHTHTATFTPSGGGGTPTVTIYGSSTAGGSPTPNNNYLGATYEGAGRNAGALYATSPSTLDPLNSATATISGVSGGGGSVTNALTGSGQAFSIEPPYLAVYFIIATTGIFPSHG